MSAILMDISAFDAALSAQKLIITANNRQRNQILRAYINGQPDAAGAAPRVLTLSQWQGELWSNYQLSGLPGHDLTLVTPSQRDYLWQQVIAEYASAQPLLQPGRLTPQAEAARIALDAWLCPLQTLQACEGETGFAQWYLAYYQRLEAYRLTTTESIQQRLIQAFEKKQLATEKEAMLYGFDDLPPLTEKLIKAALPGAKAVEARPRKAQPKLRALADSDEEIRQAALWADGILSSNPEAVIGIVIPNLGQIRDQVESIFQSVFTPLEPLPEHEASVAPYNFSAGTPLATAPVIDAALQLAHGLLKPLTLEDACEFLRNRYIGDYPAEWRLRMLGINRLRKAAAHQYSLADIRKALADLSPDSSDNSLLQKALLEIAPRQRSWHASRPFTFWQQEFEQLLTRFNWPGSRTLNSIEHQQVNLFWQQLDAFNTLAVVQPECSFREYLDALTNTLRHTPFQAQTPDSPIQILGTLEAAGLQFSDLWVMGMHNGVWPPAATPNPLLPVSLQRDWGMPKSSSERELNYAAKLTLRLVGSADRIVFSYPLSAGDRQLQVSRLIDELCDKDSQPAALTQESVQQQNYQLIAASAELEIVECQYAPPLQTEQLPGGSGILKTQAVCPFSALARYRLGAGEMDEPKLGFSAIERGNILHQVLANFWADVRDKHTLDQLPDDEIRSRLETLICDALRQAGSQAGVGRRYLELEQLRLTRQLERWLQLEKERPGFTATALEQKYTLILAGFRLGARVDRIDTLEDGRQLIIDYKTGATSPNHWRADSFFEPQLPLYACTIDPQNTAGIAFATINTDTLGFSGWGEELAIDGIKPPEQESWQDQLATWQERLQTLAEEIRAGYAPVEYRSEQAKRFDEDLICLNRINEHSELEHWSLEQE